MRWKVILPVLILATIVATQAVGYWSHVTSVSKTLMQQLPVHALRGEEAYRAAVLKELETMGMDPEAIDFKTEEDLRHDEFRVQLRYDWPLHVLVFTFELSQEENLRSVILDP